MRMFFWGIVVDGELHQIFKSKAEALKSARALLKLQDYYRIRVVRFNESDLSINLTA